LGQRRGRENLQEEAPIDEARETGSTGSKLKKKSLMNKTSLDKQVYLMYQ